MPPLIRIDVRVRERTQRATVGNLRQYGRDTVRDLAVLTEKSGARVLRTAQRLAPRDSGYMVSRIRLVISAKRLAWQLGYDESDFIGRGLAFYPVFQELGFRHWLSGEFIQNPHLRPAFLIEQPRYLRETAAMLRRGVARMRARAG